MPTCERIELVPYLTPHTQISAKCFKHLNVRPKSIKLSEEKIGGELHATGLGNDFLAKTPKAQATKIKIER